MLKQTFIENYKNENYYYDCNKNDQIEITTLHKKKNQFTQTLSILITFKFFFHVELSCINSMWYGLECITGTFSKTYHAYVKAYL